MYKPKNNGETNAKFGVKGESKAKTNSKTLIIIIGAVAIIAALLVVIIMLLVRKPAEAPAQQERTTVDSGRGVVATSENMQEIAEELEEPIPDSYYLTTMNVDWTFDTWNTPSSNAYVENSTENTRTVYFDVIVDGTGEIVYSSPFIPVGAIHEKFALSKELAAGNYPATVTYHLVDDDNNEVSTLSIGVSLQVLG